MRISLRAVLAMLAAATLFWALSVRAARMAVSVAQHHTGQSAVSAADNSGVSDAPEAVATGPASTVEATPGEWLLPAEQDLCFMEWSARVQWDRPPPRV
jgi:hypothetical protein